MYQRIVRTAAAVIFWASFLVPSPAVAAADANDFIETGDLKELRAHGRLRILLPVPHAYETHLPRQGFPIYYETVILKRFAKENHLIPLVRYVERRDELITQLLAGKADIIGANLTITDKRKQLIEFTVPYEIVTEQLVSRKNDNVAALKDLKGREIAIHRSTSFWDTMEVVRKRYPGIKILEVDETIPTEAIVEGVANGLYDLTLADSNLMKILLLEYPQLRVAMDMTSSRPIAWGVRPDAHELQTALNKFIEKEQWFRDRTSNYQADWAEIKQRKVLRVLTRNNAASYFLWRGELMGFEYDLIRRFADRNDLHVEVIVPPTRADLLQWLRDGKGDVVAASMTINEERKAEGVAFTRYYNKVEEVIVARRDDNTAQHTEDLAGRTLFLRRSSSYWQTAQALIAEGIEVHVKAVPEDMETEEIIAKVGEGAYDLTIADSHILAIELTTRDDIRSAMVLKEGQLHGWVVRQENKTLLANLNAYIKNEYHGLHYNTLYNKYFVNKHSINRHVNARVDLGNGRISPWEDITRKYSSRYDFDWRLITAQMLQESGFDPKAKSWVGAMGLMQVMPKTAAELGFTDLHNPETGLHAGVKYMDWLRDRFEPELSVRDRVWFALAAYNAGLGHVRDARLLARQMGWDANIWLNNVEQAMLLLSKPKFAKQARHGYVRGYEPVQYVRHIRDRYRAYLRLLGDKDTAQAR